jgi:hypothetical protein
VKISARLQCSPTEARRLLGQPDLLPLYQMAAETVERWVVHRIARLDTVGHDATADEADRSIDSGGGGGDSSAARSDRRP